MEKINDKNLRDLIEILFGAYRIYWDLDNSGRIELLDSLQWVFDILVSWGTPKGFGEALVVYGIFWKDDGKATKLDVDRQQEAISRQIILILQGIWGIKASELLLWEKEALKMAYNESESWLVAKGSYKGGEVTVKVLLN